MIVRPLSTVDTTRDYAHVSHSITITKLTASIALNGAFVLYTLQISIGNLCVYSKARMYVVILLSLFISIYINTIYPLTITLANIFIFIRRMKSTAKSEEENIYKQIYKSSNEEL